MKISNKNMAFITSVLVILIVVFSLIMSNPENQFTLILNDKTYDGPLTNILGGILGTVIATVVLFCVGTISLFVFSGVGMIILTVLVLIGGILLTVAVPFLLPIIIPLLLLYFFVAYTKRKKQNNPA